MRSLHADGRSRRAIWFLLIPVAVLGAWSTWFVKSHVARYEGTDRARLEVDHSIHVMQAPISGRVVYSGLVPGRELKEGDLVVEIEAAPQQDLRSQVQQLEGDRLTAGKTTDRRAYEITHRRIAAPVSGKLGEVAVLRPGGYVVEGDKLGAIIPSGELRVIAEFPLPAALGRIRAGQPGRLRLQGFPWTQFGSVPTRVTSVGEEVRYGYVRVELAVDRTTTSIPLQNGLPGSVEIEVENVSPATMLLRAAGQMVSAPKTPSNRQTP